MDIDASQLLEVGGGLNVGKPNRAGRRTISEIESGKTLGYCNASDEDLVAGNVALVESMKKVDPEEQKIAAIRAAADAAKQAKKDKNDAAPPGGDALSEETPNGSEAG